VRLLSSGHDDICTVFKEADGKVYAIIRARTVMATREIKLSYLEELGREVGELIAQLREFGQKVDIASRSTGIEADISRKQ